MGRSLLTSRFVQKLRTQLPCVSATRGCKVLASASKKGNHGVVSRHCPRVGGEGWVLTKTGHSGTIRFTCPVETGTVRTVELYLLWREITACEVSNNYLA